MTDDEIKKVLADITIVVDTREKKNGHILDYLENQRIPFIHEKLDSGDYSVKFTKYKDLKLDGCVLVERKNSLDEIAGNFTKNRDRFVREFDRAETPIHILVENATWTKLLNGSYRSKFHPKSFMASIMTWHYRFKAPVWFCTKRDSPELIHALLFYGVREVLKEY